MAEERSGAKIEAAAELKPDGIYLVVVPDGQVEEAAAQFKGIREAYGTRFVVVSDKAIFAEAPEIREIVREEVARALAERELSRPMTGLEVIGSPPLYCEEGASAAVRELREALRRT